MNLKSVLFIVLTGLLIGGAVSVLGMKYWNSASIPIVQIGNYAKIIEQFNQDYVLFTNSTCAFCKKEKEYLDNQNISYKEIVIDKDLINAEYFFEVLKEQAVPILFSKNRKLIGYNEVSLDQFVAAN